jgi:acyl-ACP thioesterase
VDINSHANYLSFLEWILESIPPEVRIESQIAEMEIHFLREASYGEEILSKSLLNGAEYLHSLVRTSDGTEVVRARTVWRPVSGTAQAPK